MQKRALGSLRFTIYVYFVVGACVVMRLADMARVTEALLLIPSGGIAVFIVR